MFTMAEIMRMSEAELRPIVAKEAKKARKRADRIFRSEDLYTSPAISRARKSKPRVQAALFETKGKSLNQLRREYKRIKNFMEDKTSTIKGTKKFYKNAADKLSEATSDNFDEDTIKDVFDIFGKLEDNNAWIANARFKYEVFEAINDQVQQADDKTSRQDIINNLNTLLDDIYEENMDLIDSGDDWTEDLNNWVDDMIEE